MGKNEAAARPAAAPQSSPLPMERLTISDTCFGVTVDCADRSPLLTIAKTRLTEGREKEIAALIVRRVNEGPKVDAMAEAFGPLMAMAERVANLNSVAGEIGPGMLASLVEDARFVLAKARAAEAVEAAAREKSR